MARLTLVQISLHTSHEERRQKLWHLGNPRLVAQGFSLGSPWASLDQQQKGL
jgi:hypothetical protein